MIWNKLISPLRRQLRTSYKKVLVKNVGPVVVVYKGIDFKSLLLCTLDGNVLQGLFEHERLKPAVIRTSQGNVTTLPQLNQGLYVAVKLN